MNWKARGRHFGERPKIEAKGKKENNARGGE